MVGFVMRTAVAGFAILGMASSGAVAAGGTAEKPYRMEAVAGTSLKRIVLTPKAARRIDVKTGQMSTDAEGRLRAPYAAVFFDLKGETLVYTNPEPLTFIRQKVAVASVDAHDAILTEGPPTGMNVVTLGVAELYGTERGIGH